jgi:hypothetical protein
LSSFDVFENPLVIKHLTKLAQASEEYTAKLELNTAEGEAYRTRLDIGNIFKLLFSPVRVCNSINKLSILK